MGLSKFAQFTMEKPVLVWLESVGYTVLPGLHIVPGKPQGARTDYGQMVLEDQLRHALVPLRETPPIDRIIQELLRGVGV